jgi:PAS domain S-box-containing protein
VCNDFIEDPATAPWHQLAAFHGFRASISLPLRRGDVCVGTLTAYSARRDCFDDDAVALLHDLAHSISFALGSFERREQRLQVDAALRLSEARLLDAQAIGDIGDWSYDLEWHAMTWSPQMYRLYERDPANGPPSREEVFLYLDADSERAMSECLRRAARAGESGKLECTVRLPSGGQRHHAAVIVPVKDGAGRVVALQGTVQDITARKQVEMKLRQKEAQLEEAQRLAGMGNWEWLAEVGNTHWSTTLFEILALSPDAPIPESEQLLGMLTAESRDIVREAAEQTLRTGRPYEVDLEVVCADGVRKWLTCRGQARRSHGQIVGIYGTVQDVTARRRREAERAARELHMHELSHRLIAAQEDERRRLAAELHDRTSPNLAAVQVTLSSLRLGMPEAVLTALGDEFDDLKALLQDTTTSIRDVCADLRPALLDYAGLIPALESHIQQFARRTGVLVKLDHRGIDARLPAELEALLFRIVLEALTNCAKHAQARTIHIALKRRRKHHLLTIADDGAGFDPAMMSSGSKKPGLGLLTMRERAEFAGGNLRIESSPGRGTTIRVEV